MLEDTLRGGSPITKCERDRGDENKGELGGGYSESSKRLTRILALKSLGDTK